MARYAIFTCDNMYGGLHGMNDRFVDEFTDTADAINCAIEHSYEVIDSYYEIYDTIDENLESMITEDMTEEDIENLREELRQEDVDYNIWKINEDECYRYSCEELSDMFYNMEDEFVDLYCKPIDWA